MTNEKTYLTQLPERVPEGQVLVHNCVWPRQRLNAHGFRAWLQAPAENLVVCRCGWARELSEHYIAQIH